MDPFERLIVLAEFGAKRMEDRRTVEFRSFFSYLTLLALTFYFSTKENGGAAHWNAQHPWLTLLLCLMHFFYCWWQKDLGVAMENDKKRRNFYSVKAECVADYFLSHPNRKKFQKRDQERVRVDFCEHKVRETRLFKKIHPPDIFMRQLRHPLKSFLMNWGLLWTDWTRRLHVAVPTIVLIGFLCFKHNELKETSNNRGSWSEATLSNYLIPMLTSHRNKDCWLKTIWNNIDIILQILGFLLIAVSVFFLPLKCVLQQWQEEKRRKNQNSQKQDDNTDESR